MQLVAEIKLPKKPEKPFDVYKVWDEEGSGHIFVIADSIYNARAEYVFLVYGERSRFADYFKGVHYLIVEKDIDPDEMGVGERTIDYVRSRGIDLMLSGVIDPNWYTMGDSSFDDYRNWHVYRRPILTPKD